MCIYYMNSAVALDHSYKLLSRSCNMTSHEKQCNSSHLIAE